MRLECRSPSWWSSWPRALAVPLLALMAWGLIGISPAHAQSRTVRVATLTDGPGLMVSFFRDPLMKTIVALVGDDAKIVFPDEVQLIGDWTAATTRAQIEGLMANPGYDILVTLGGISSHIVARRDVLPKPVVAAAVYDADVQRLPRSGASSGKRNLTYITDELDLARDFQLLGQVVKFKKLAVLMPPAVLETMPELGFAALSQLKGLGIQMVQIGVSADPEATVAAIPQDVDAVYVTWQPQLGPAEQKRLIDAINARRLPSISAEGRFHVEMGALMSRRAATDLERYMRRVALSVQQIATGEPASELPVRFQSGEQLTINLATARALGLSPGWRVLTEAELIDTDPPDLGPKVTLVDAVREAVENNRQLAAERAAVDTGEHTVAKATAPLLPDVTASLSGATIDADRAAAAFGAAPQHAASAKLEVTQLIYSDAPYANRDIQGHLQEQRQLKVRETMLDVIHSTADAYLNVLRARTASRIQRDNLKLTRSNLATARTRARIGAGRTVDIHRWEAQIATDQQSVIQAQTQEQMALTVLNQAMGRPLTQPMAMEEAVMADPNMLTARPDIIVRLQNPRGFRRFQAFMAQEAVARSPEIAQLDAGIAAAERSAKMSRRSWIPTVALQGDVSYRFLKGGEGVDTLSISFSEEQLSTLDASGLATLNVLGQALVFPTQDDLTYTVALAVSLPLYEGGERYANIREADAQLVQLRRQREALVERIEQRVVLAVQQMGSAFPRIELSAESAASTRKSLTIAQDAYRRGVESETTLLDIQRSARVSDDLASNAVFDFLVELMAVHRAVGDFYFLASPEERADFDKRFFEFMDAPATGGAQEVGP